MNNFDYDKFIANGMSTVINCQNTWLIIYVQLLNGKVLFLIKNPTLRTDKTKSGMALIISCLSNYAWCPSNPSYIKNGKYCKNILQSLSYCLAINSVNITSIMNKQLLNINRIQNILLLYLSSANCSFFCIAISFLNLFRCSSKSLLSLEFSLVYFCTLDHFNPFVCEKLLTSLRFDLSESNDSFRLSLIDEAISSNLRFINFIFLDLVPRKP